MLDIYTERRQQIAAQVRNLINVRGPRTAAQKLTLANLLKESDEIEIGITDEHEKRQSAAFSMWLRGGGNAIQTDQRKLLREVQTRDMQEVGLASGSASGAGVFVPP